MKTLNGTVVVEIVINPHNCPSCGVVWGLAADFEERLRETGGAFYCPNGHRLSYAGELARLKKEAEDANRQAQMSRDSERRAWEEVEAKNAEIRRVKRSAAAGKCPCCKRTFQQVARHVIKKHPDFAADQNIKAVQEKHVKGEKR